MCRYDFGVIMKTVNEQIQELRENIAYLECWLRHPDSLSEYEQAERELRESNSELEDLLEQVAHFDQARAEWGVLTCGPDVSFFDGE
jgi:hypothetical protein